MNLSKILFHPLFVHFPIALCFFEFFLLSLASLKKNTTYVSFARLTFHVLAVCLIGTLVTGYRDAGGAIADLWAGGVKPHFYSACVFTLIVLVRFALWKRFQPDHPRSFNVQLVSSLFMIAAVVVTAYWGGELVYN